MEEIVLRRSANQLLSALLRAAPRVLQATYDEARWRFNAEKITRQEIAIIVRRLRQLGWDGDHSFVRDEGGPPEPVPEPLFKWHVLRRCRLCREDFSTPLPATFRNAGEANLALSRESNSKKLQLHTDWVEGVSCLGLTDTIGLSRG